MRICLYSFYSGKNAEYRALYAQYFKKISLFSSFDMIELRTKSLSRGSQSEKIEFEDVKMLSVLKSSDLVIGFDEVGESFKGSRDFSKYFVKLIESGKTRLVFLIGGPFGLGPKVKTRCDRLVSLSPLTFNHHVAQLVVLEQIYRAWTIHKNLPYHN